MPKTVSRQYPRNERGILDVPRWEIEIDFTLNRAFHIEAAGAVTIPWAFPAYGKQFGSYGDAAGIKCTASARGIFERRAVDLERAGFYTGRNKTRIQVVVTRRRRSRRSYLERYVSAV